MVAADVTSSVSVYKEHTGASEEYSDPFSFKTIMVELPATANGTNADYYTLTLADYGITELKTVKGFRHTTAYSVIVADEPTTSVTGGVLTVTLGADAGAAKRVHIIGGV